MAWVYIVRFLVTVRNMKLNNFVAESFWISVKALLNNLVQSYLGTVELQTGNNWDNLLYYVWKFELL
jgi:hypothetical protein